MRIHRATSSCATDEETTSAVQTVSSGTQIILDSFTTALDSPSCPYTNCSIPFHLHLHSKRLGRSEGRLHLTRTLQLPRYDELPATDTLCASLILADQGLHGSTCESQSQVKAIPRVDSTTSHDPAFHPSATKWSRQILHPPVIRWDPRSPWWQELELTTPCGLTGHWLRGPSSWLLVVDEAKKKKKKRILPLGFGSLSWRS